MTQMIFNLFLLLSVLLVPYAIIYYHLNNIIAMFNIFSLYCSDHIYNFEVNEEIIGHFHNLRMLS